LYSVYERSVLPYVKAWGLQLADKLQTRLPAEIRDMIYSYLWDRETIIAYPDLSKVAGGSKCLDDFCTCSTPHDSPTLPYFVQPTFMGPAIACEIVRALYDAFHSKGKVLTIRKPGHIKTAVTKDVFHVGLDPGQHLRSLVVRVKLDRLRKPRPTGCARTEVCRHDPTEKVYIKDDLQELLATLLYIKHKARFALWVAFFQRNIRVAVLEEALQVLGPVRRTFQRRGAIVNVHWHYRGFWAEGVDMPPDGVAVVKEMDDFFVIPRMAWKTNMIRFLLEVNLLASSRRPR